MREANGRRFSVGRLGLALALPGAALACAVDDRTAGLAEASEAMAGAGAEGVGDPPQSAAGSGFGAVAASGAGGAGNGAGGAGNGGGLASGGASGGAVGTVGTAPGSGGSGGDAAAAAGAAGAAVVLPSALCGEQLLANGDFDAGRTGWQEEWEVRETVIARNDPLLAAAGVSPHGGDYLGWLGGVANGEFGQKYLSRLSQTVTFPEATVSLTFSGFVWIEQPELGVMPTSDWAVIEFLDPLVTEGYDDLWQIVLWNEEDVTSGWVEFSFVQVNQMERFRGRSLPLVADSRPDGNGTMSVFLDSLRLEARCE